MKKLSPVEAVRAIPDGSRVIVPGGCADPAAFYQAFSAEVERFERLTLCCGYSLGDYRFLERGLGDHFRYVTWQASPRLRRLFKENDPRKVAFVPIRLAEVHKVVAAGGPLHPDVCVIQCGPPAADGSVSLGISVGPYPPIVRCAGLVIAEVNPAMPRMEGEARIAADDIDILIDGAETFVEYPLAAATDRDERIIDHVLDLIPDDAWVQLGIGSVPDNVLPRLADKRGINLFSGFYSGGLQPFIEAARHTPTIVTGELAGSREFYDFCGRTPRIEMASTAVTHDLARVAALPRFVSVNSCVEVDLQGQVNSEVVAGGQLSGVGGALDYVEAATLSDGGCSILALPSTTADGRHSRIVARLGEGAPVTIPRVCTDYVVTEYGVARLRGLDLRARAAALSAIAHPDFRTDLEATFA